MFIVHIVYCTYSIDYEIKVKVHAVIACKFLFTTYTYFIVRIFLDCFSCLGEKKSSLATTVSGKYAKLMTNTGFDNN